MIAANKAQKAGQPFEKVAETTIVAAKKRRSLYESKDPAANAEIQMEDQLEIEGIKELNEEAAAETN